ncbi:tryptophan transporter [Heyndrickxia sp. NPDC080065]|uniref:tryptophan transporter n=1 Tax=Heyndrickxia sp. NPDC080065 TaxID=3390568 RepID=UPI003D05152A
MNTKTLVTLSLFVGIGAVLHLVIPQIFLGMKPDMMLTMMFLGILLFPRKKNVLLLGVVTGILSGITTSFPGGLIPNIIDKILTSFIFFGLFLLISKRLKSMLAIIILTIIGTLVSGVIFLTSAYFIFSLPDSFKALFSVVVLPATVLNSITLFILYPIVNTIIKRTTIAENI